MKHKRISPVLFLLFGCVPALLCGCTRKAETGGELDEIVFSEYGLQPETAAEDASEAAEEGAGIVAAEDKSGAAAEDTAAAEDKSGMPAEDTAAEPERSDCYVYICGAVENPGVYRMEPDDRIFAVIEKAGGFTETACQDYVNQAKAVADGLKVRIPTLEEAEAERKAGQQAGGTGQYGAGEDAGLEYPKQTEGAAAGQSGETAGLVNINTAAKEQLCTLTGIGESKAQAIIEYRNAHGGFSEKEDIMKVTGIKQSGYEKIKDYITVRQE